MPVPIFLLLPDNQIEFFPVLSLLSDHPEWHLQFLSANPSVPASDFSPVPTLTNVPEWQEAGFPVGANFPDVLPNPSYLLPVFLFVLLFFGFLSADG